MLDFQKFSIAIIISENLRSPIPTPFLINLNSIQQRGYEIVPLIEVLNK